ncbi:MAG TPA: type I-E CRISPR-associated protein Cse2/CasB [Victivallales bacterium]|nr:type I-E CRISPR-associated protein Cse2/CasB [Victivallales bacterium]
MEENKKMDIEGLMKFLRQNRDNRGVMADLRRGLSKTTESRAWPHIAQFCDLSKEREREIVQTIAAAFATCDESSDCGNIGETMRKIATGGRKENDGLKTFESRFRRLLSASGAEELCDFLPGIIRTAKTKGIPINLYKLFNDLQFWGDKVKIQWATSYWVSNNEKGGGDEISDKDNG